jgi:hypothetical protein
MVDMTILWIGIGLIIGVLLKSLYNRTPIHDSGFSINRFTTADTLERVAAALHDSGIRSARPRLRLDSQHVRRIIFPGGKIMNWTDDTLLQSLDLDQAHAFVVRNPEAASRKVVSYLQAQGVNARVIPDFDESVKAGAMTMVTIDGERTGLIFRRDVKMMGGPLPRRYKRHV